MKQNKEQYDYETKIFPLQSKYVPGVINHGTQYLDEMKVTWQIMSDEIGPSVRVIKLRKRKE